ncbi:MAG: HAD family hydrolase [Bacteroidetes bacterium]|nr:HAD family hydrolase [Bacteroidota bacterium]MBU1113865.1 HAD family hydrolase [Bacteroidota bacterium]MBU1798109.1 HAD family hydrolase [Bacteroidota bacterium]
MSQPAVFFDRDNTLNYDPGYLSDPNLVRLFDGVGEGIAKLRNEFNFKIVVISNQSGISRGYFSEKEVVTINEKINSILKLNFNTQIDAFYFCPYHPDFSSEEESKCRKPSPLLVFKAAGELDIDLTNSYFVGDSISDIECGINANLKTVLVNYENDKGKIISLKNINKTPTFIVENFLNACNSIITDFTGGKLLVK